MKTIFIVDDNDTNLMTAKLALEGIYKTYSLQSASIMFKLIERIRPDLILLDIDMPVMDGFQTIEILKSNDKLKSIPVIFLTAKNDPESEARGLELGAVDFIIKPFSKPVLIKRIDNHIGTNIALNDKQQIHGNQVNFTKGSYIIVEDKRVPDQFFIILKGTVSLSKELLIPIRNKTEELGPGDFLGIISAMAGHSQIETAQALTDVVLMPVRYDNFDKFIQENVQVASKILLEFSKRMRYLNEILAGLTFKKRSITNTSHLFNVAEYYVNQKQYDTAACVYRKFIKYCPKENNAKIAQQRLSDISSHIKTEMQYIKASDLTRIYPRNTMIFCEGEPGDEVFFIKQGMVKISKVIDTREILLAILNKGEVFGEMAIIESTPRGASAIAYEDTQVMVINNSNFAQLFTIQPALITHITSILAKRIWLVYKKITNTQIKDPVGRMLDMLFIQLEKKRVNVNVKELYVFDFGPRELINLIGLSLIEGNIAVQKLLKARYLGLVHNKIAIKDMFEFFKQANFYRSQR